MTLNSAHTFAHSVPPVAMRPSRKPRIVLIFLIALCGIFIYSYTARLAEKSSVDERIVATQARIAAAKQEQLELLEEQEKVNQQDYLDQQARKLFDHAKPGDTMLVIVDHPEDTTGVEASSGAASTNAIDFRNFPVWQQWVVFFTSANIKLSLQ